MQALVFVPVVYFLILFQQTAEKFFHYLLLFFASLLFYATFGQWLVYATPAQPVALVRGVLRDFLMVLKLCCLLMQMSVVRQ